jgi:CheY-like chemotaxis protein
VWGETPPLSPPAGRWVRLTVTDTGSGIPQETLPRIFEPFFTTKAPGQGSGLGLPQVQGIVAQHGGYINVRSREGEGTVVTLYLPASDDAQSGDRAAPDVVAMPLGNQETILVVEDDPSVRAALVAGLSQLNYTVVPAENGETALEIISTESTSIDLVLSDVVMPAMGGIALMHTLQARGWEIPVILLTGHPLDRELEGLREAGLAAWMSKPPRLERLAQMIHEVLRSA